jgi:hypothetical protein
MTASARRRFRRVTLGLILAILVLRMAILTYRFGKDSLQMDFAAFYTAGQALNAGLSPYQNYVTRQPPLWDGVAAFTHSRFLYPPLAASFFQPWTLLTYRYAKYGWTIVCLAALFLALWIAGRLVLRRQSGAAWLWLIVTCAVLAYYPVLTLLERGQVDSLTLLLVMLAVAAMTTGRCKPAAGLLLALATLLKLHLVFIVPFLVLRRRWTVLAGYALGCLLIAGLSYTLNGPELTERYLQADFWRIANYGQWGTPEMELPPAVLEGARAGLAAGDTRKDGAVYHSYALVFAQNASLVRTSAGEAVLRLLRQNGLPGASPSLLSALLFGVLWLAFAAGGWHAPVAGPEAELTYWQAALVIILLCAPLTWTMNTVWLLPVVVIWMQQIRGRRPAHWGAAPVLCLLGLGLAGLPDQYAFPALGLWQYDLFEYKYVVAELLVLWGLTRALSFRMPALLGRPASAGSPSPAGSLGLKSEGRLF